MKWIIVFALAFTAVAQEQSFAFVSKYEVEYGGKVVTGAPYSAQAVTEMTQVLADGNRITRKTSALIARDSQGRTRREQNLKNVGPWSSPEGNGVVFINDPVSGTRYTLESGAKVAIKATLNSEDQQKRQLLERRLKEATRSKEEAEQRANRRNSNEPGNSNEPKTASTTESLGTRTIEGVVAEGKRVTETIPAGRLGNEKPIEVINETWYSSELQTVLMSKHSDPRSGDVVYTLTNISRAEPDASMFSVPQDYKIRDESSLKVRE